MKSLLDTSSVVDHLRGVKPIDEPVVSEGVGISVITYLELIYGVYKSRNFKKNLSIVCDLIENMNIEIVGIDLHVSNEYGKNKALLENEGKTIDDFDLIIGCAAKVYNLKLVTRNSKHFERIKGLIIEKN